MLKIDLIIGLLVYVTVSGNEVNSHIHTYCQTQTHRLKIRLKEETLWISATFSSKYYTYHRHVLVYFLWFPSVCVPILCKLG